MSSNTMIAIGWTGVKRCYINTSRENAVRRYMQATETSAPPTDDMITEFAFDDEFAAYDVWPEP